MDARRGEQRREVLGLMYPDGYEVKIDFVKGEGLGAFEASFTDKGVKDGDVFYGWVGMHLPVDFRVDDELADVLGTEDTVRPDRRGFFVLHEIIEAQAVWTPLGEVLVLHVSDPQGSVLVPVQVWNLPYLVGIYK